MTRPRRHQGTSLSAGPKRVKPPYDIRDQIQDSELDAESIQCVYDDINRMVILMGDIPFKQLFLTPIAKLAPVLQGRLEELQRYGLIRDPDHVIELGKMLLKHAGRLTVGNFYARPRRGLSNEIWQVLLALRREGIRIPLPTGTAEESKARALVIKRLVNAAPDFTFKQYHTRAKNSLPRAVRSALAFARLHALLGWGVNDRCCDHDRFTKLGYCRPKEGSWCALATDPAPTEHKGILYGFCVDSSSQC